MKRVVVAVRDSAMLAFAQPIVVPSVGVAVRSFSDEVNRREPGNVVAAHPEDYELWYVADYEEESAGFSVPDEGVRVLARGKDFVKE